MSGSSFSFIYYTFLLLVTMLLEGVEQRLYRLVSRDNSQIHNTRPPCQGNGCRVLQGEESRPPTAAVVQGSGSCHHLCYPELHKCLSTPVNLVIRHCTVVSRESTAHPSCLHPKCLWPCQSAAGVKTAEVCFNSFPRCTYHWFINWQIIMHIETPSCKGV